MQDSKKILNRILLVVLMTAFVAAGIFVFKTYLSGENLTELYIGRVKQLEEKHQDVDMFLAGGSRIYRSFDPDILDEVLGLENTTNCGSPNQRPPLTYYLVEDFLERFNPKYVIIGATYNGMQYEQPANHMSYVMDRMKPENKFKSLWKIFGFEGFLVATGKAEYMENLTFEAIEGHYKMRTREYTKTLDAGESTHKSNGFSGSHVSLENGSVTNPYGSPADDFDENNITDETMLYYDRIIDLCKKKGIKVVMVTGPCTLYKMYRVENYQGAVKFFEKYAKEHNVSYYNLNYLKNREEIMPDTLFKDKTHLNYDGGQKISRIFANILKEDFEGKDTSKYFYKDFDELKKDVHRIASCQCKVKHNNEDAKILLSSYHNEDVRPEYRIVSLDGKVIVDWTKSEKIEMSYKELKKYKTIKAQARIKSDNEIYAFTTTEVK